MIKTENKSYVNKIKYSKNILSQSNVASVIGYVIKSGIDIEKSCRIPV